MDHHVMGIVLRSPDRDMKEAVLECPEVFLELDCLNRPGQVAQKQNRPGHYSLSRQGNRKKGLLHHKGGRYYAWIDKMGTVWTLESVEGS